MSNLKELINKYTEMNDELHELGHEIDHKVYSQEFIIVLNKNGDEEDIVSLIVDDEDEYYIPVYTDEEEAKEAIEVFKEEPEANEFITAKAIGKDLVEEYSEDEDFLGLAINYPQTDFIILSEEVHEC